MNEGKAVRRGKKGKRKGSKDERKVVNEEGRGRKMKGRECEGRRGGNVNEEKAV